MTHPSQALPKAPDALAALLKGTGSAVVLNHPAEHDRLMSLSAALDYALTTAEVSSMTTIVGYFHHNPLIKSPHIREDDPARLILDHIDHLPNLDQLTQPPHYRLLAGLLCSQPAALAARLWYWLNRWRIAQPAQAHAHRAAFLAHIQHLESQSCSRADAFSEAALKLLDVTAFNDAQGPLQLGLELPALLTPLEGETRALLTRCWHSTLYSLGAHDEVPHAAINTFPPMKGTRTPQREATAKLYAFFMLTGAHFKIAPGHSIAAQAGERTTATIATFHPKMYVMERVEPDGRRNTLAVIGSNNWSGRALGAGWTKDDGALGNVEVATLHTTAGHAWTRPDPADDSLAHKTASAARYIFEHTGETLGAWHLDTTPHVQRVFETLAVYTKPVRKLKEPPVILPDEPDEVEEIEEPEEAHDAPEQQTPPIEPPDAVSAALREIAPDLIAAVERILGLTQREQIALMLDLFKDPQHKLFGGQTPSRYQLDGALRLVSMLRAEDAGALRGAFLTDEAGIGKTLTASLCIMQLIVTRLIQRAEHFTGEPIPVLRVSIIAPARLIGYASSDESATGWHRHAKELGEGVRAMLAAYHKLQVMGRSINPDAPPHPLLNTSLVSRLADELLSIRVFSAGAFSRELLEDPAQLDDSGLSVDQLRLKPGSKQSDPVADLLHIATSELVLVDESHNFRNQGSRATRALRFVLSLPALGEQWPLLRNEESETPSATSPAMRAHRRVLLLSATPFNNRIDDLTTQIGHFSHHQRWYSAPKASTNQPALALSQLSPLDDALNTWRTASMTDIGTPDVRAAFEVLLRHSVKHLRSGRALYVDPDKQVEREADQKRLRERLSDGGPEYAWPVSYGEVKIQLGAVYGWLNRKRRGEEIELEEEREVRLRLDALLCALVVQRSRARALRITEATEGAQIDKMFRAPTVPRHPLALNKPNVEQDSFEATILNGLYRLLAQKEVDPAQALDEDTLDLFPYRLNIKRAKHPFGAALSSGTGEQLEQTIQNNLGFQRVGMVKRLQSSPYALMRTLLRGPLRRALYEMALVEQLLRCWDDLRQGEPHPLDALIETLRSAHKERVDTVQLDWPRDRLQAIAESLGGLQDPQDDLYFGELGGIYATSQARAKLLQDRTISQRFERDFDELKLWLGLHTSSERFDMESFEQSWAYDLLHDMASTQRESRLMHDVNTIMRWSFDRKNGLVTKLYEGAGLIEHDGKRLQARPMIVLQRAFLSQPAYNGRILDWLLARLKQDGRLCAMLSWTVLQHDLASQLDPAVWPDLPSLSQALPGGRRTLVFSEYTDTQDYILATMAALHHVVTHGSASSDGLRKLVKLLVEEGRGTLERLQEQAAQVRAARLEEVAPSSQTADTRLFLAPVDLTHPAVKELLAALHEPHSEAVCSRIMLAARALCERTARVSSARTGRLLDSMVAVEADAVSDEPSFSDELVEEEERGSLREDNVIEAFSPWYQIAPGVADSSSAERLRNARQRPVDLLFATEVLSEGVNLQECGVVLHYDLPWNPTRLIQRNGRVDRRISQTYEERGLREELLAQLNVSVSEAPEFVGPRRVAHLTLLPVEPLGGDVGELEVTRVRQSLFEKLDTIRALFGLSAWPVVLSQEVARQVLNGELDHETPGFRRREELFRHWRGLLEIQDMNAHRPNHARTLTLRLPTSARRAFALCCAGLTRDPERLEEQAWEQLRAAGILLWTPRAHQSVPVRSAPEATKLRYNKEPSERIGAITGALLLRDTPREAGLLALLWGKLKEGRQSLYPVLMRPVEPILSSGVNAELAKASLRHAAARVVGEPLDLATPASPTGLAEELLATLLEVCLDQRVPLKVVDTSSDITRVTPSAESIGLACAPIVNDYLNLLLDEGSLPDEMYLQRALTPKPATFTPHHGPQQPLANLWVCFE